MRTLLLLTVLVSPLTISAQVLGEPGASAAIAIQTELQTIPRDAKIYIAPFTAEDGNSHGFEVYFAAAIRKKRVPITMVTDRTQADFEITGTAGKKGAGWAKKLLAGDYRATTSASFQVINLKTGVIAYADSSYRASANRGLRSTAEKLAKYLKRKIENDEKRTLKH